MRGPVIIEPFGGMCQDRPKDGSHFLSQVDSKQDSEAFGPGEGKRFPGICPCCIDLPATPANTRSLPTAA